MQIAEAWPNLPAASGRKQCIVAPVLLPTRSGRLPELNFALQSPFHKSTESHVFSVASDFRLFTESMKWRKASAKQPIVVPNANCEFLQILVRNSERTTRNHRFLCGSCEILSRSCEFLSRSCEFLCEIWHFPCGFSRFLHGNYETSYRNSRFLKVVSENRDGFRQVPYRIWRFLATKKHKRHKNQGNPFVLFVLFCGSILLRQCTLVKRIHPH